MYLDDKLTVKKSANSQNINPRSYFVRREHYQGDVENSFEHRPFSFSSLQYYFLPFESILEYVRTFHFNPKRELPILFVWCGGVTKFGMIYEHFVPRNIITNFTNGKRIFISGTLGSDPGNIQLEYDPNNRRHDDCKHITCVSWLNPR